MLIMFMVINHLFGTIFKIIFVSILKYLGYHIKRYLVESKHFILSISRRLMASQIITGDGEARMTIFIRGKKYHLNRIVKIGFTLHRPPINISRYKMNQIKHTTNYFAENSRGLNHKKHLSLVYDGLSTLTYKSTKHELYPLYTNIQVDFS
ncbi:hypothetical protein RF11_01010 [Thelohanellus kitauei]|uniref:Uncharacterized protein n=1 Tax=Thelohanellus kitauei TaxID=669202 RepID=A0A0C2J0Z3_THEKT|nr:hypothetical protein RF11_01010 [Thelohanellus kitauei]